MSEANSELVADGSLAEASGGPGRISGDVAAYRRPGSDRRAIRFAVLGPLQAWSGDQELELGPRQQRSILALLLVHPGQPVALEILVEALWGDQPPPSAINVIHKYIGSIRRVVEPGLTARDSGRWLFRQGGGYRLNTDEETSDLLEFRALCHSAKLADVAGDGARAVELITGALALWRGSCSAGLGLAGNQQAAFDSIDRERSDAAYQAADIALRHGGVERILPYVRASVLDDFFNEPLQARFVLLLATSGRQAEAVYVLQTLRTSLQEELGIDPGPELREAQERVLRQDLSTPGATVSTRTAGEVATDDTPALSVMPLAQLPQDLVSFAGRCGELTEAVTFVGDQSSRAVALVAIDGMAGIGKSTFAVRLAHLIAGDFPDGQLYLNLRGFDADRIAALSPATALRHLLTALGTPAPAIPDSVQARSGLYRSLLAGKRVLLLLDNARDVDQVRPLLPGSAGSVVIVTSRNSLVGLAATNGAHLVSLGLLSEAASRDALAMRLGATRVDAEPEAVDQLVAQSSHLPLALAIMGARAAANPKFPLSALAAELSAAERSLDAFGMTESAITPRTVFSWSYRLLSPDAARLFRLLSQHPGADITPSACANLVGAEARRGRALAAELRDASLILEHAPGRYVMHDLIRAYATELCIMSDSEEDRVQAFNRLFDHYLQCSYRAQVVLRPTSEPVAPSPPSPGVTVGEDPMSYDDAMGWFLAERQVLNCLIEYAAARRADLPVWQLALAMQQFYHWNGFIHDWLNSATVALSAAKRAGDRPGQGHIHRSLAGACWYLGRGAESLEHLREAQTIYQDLGYTTEQANIHLNFGQIFNATHQPHEGKKHNEIAFGLFRRVGNVRGMARALVGIGVAQSMLSETEPAMLSFGRGAELARSADLPHEEADALAQWSRLLSRTGQHAEAIAQLNQALDILRRFGHPILEALTLRVLGDSYEAAGDTASAHDARRRAEAIAKHLGFGDQGMPPGQRVAALHVPESGTSGPSRPGFDGSVE